MELLRESQIDDDRVDRRFGYSPIPALVMLAVGSWPAIAAPYALVVHHGTIPWWAWAPIGLGVLVGGFIWYAVAGGLWHGIRACGRPTNWVMKTTGSGVYLKVRSYGNYHFPEDGPTVAFVRFDEIASAAKLTEWAKRHRRNRDTLEVRQGRLRLQLKHADTDALADLVAAERVRKPPKTGISSIRFKDVPVVVAEPGVILVDWRGRGMLRALESRVKIASDRKRRIGATPEGPGTLDDEIVQLVERGETMAAIEAVRKRYGMDLTEARTFIEELGEGDVEQSDVGQA